MRLPAFSTEGYMKKTCSHAEQPCRTGLQGAVPSSPKCWASVGHQPGFAGLGIWAARAARCTSLLRASSFCSHIRVVQQYCLDNSLRILCSPTFCSGLVTQEMDELASQGRASLLFLRRLRRIDT